MNFKKAYSHQKIDAFRFPSAADGDAKPASKQARNITSYLTQRKRDSYVSKIFYKTWIFAKSRDLARTIKYQLI
ncbi:MAG: hypothetical protein DHS20C18_27220 [Saprospiraceae bacterium]|nr:MAG: hypothetical protein DHS20C18_27220 [Saprospiraceae bacterium]